ncbi:MAG: sigma-70 family RNA polymerase sigma factor [Myxococcota bacterium]
MTTLRSADASAALPHAPTHRLSAAALRARQHEVQRGLCEHLPALLRHASRRARTRDEARDLVQETSLRALAFAWSFEPGTNLRGWLHQVLDSVFLTQCRRRTRERRAFDALQLDPCSWPKQETQPPMQRMTQSVTRALAELPPNFRDVVRLVDVEELSYRDAADTLRVPLGTIMSRLHRGRRLLASALADNDQTQRAA